MDPIRNKKLNTYVSISIYGIIILTFLIQSCNTNATAEYTSTAPSIVPIEIPSLLTRDTIIVSTDGKRPISEDKYNEFSSSIIADPNNFKAYLNLAELFIKEASITGEYSYYYPAASKMVNYVLSNDLKEQSILFQAYNLKTSIDSFSNK